MPLAVAPRGQYGVEPPCRGAVGEWYVPVIAPPAAPSTVIPAVVVMVHIAIMPVAIPPSVAWAIPPTTVAPTGSRAIPTRSVIANVHVIANVYVATRTIDDGSITTANAWSVTITRAITTANTRSVTVTRAITSANARSVTITRSVTTANAWSVTGTSSGPVPGANLTGKRHRSLAATRAIATQAGSIVATAAAAGSISAGPRAASHIARATGSWSGTGSGARTRERSAADVPQAWSTGS